MSCSIVRRLLLAALVVMTLTACTSNNGLNVQATPTKSPEEVNQALSGLVEQRDEFQEISAYYAQTSIDNVDNSDFYLYFIKDSDGSVNNLHFVVRYIGDAQINTKWIMVNADGQKFTITNNARYLMKSSISYTTVTEVYDTSVYLNDLKMIKAMANAEKAIVRCTGLGLYEEDIVLSKRQKQAMLNVLRAYKNAGGVNEIYGDEL